MTNSNPTKTKSKKKTTELETAFVLSLQDYHDVVGVFKSKERLLKYVNDYQCPESEYTSVEELTDSGQFHIIETELFSEV